MRSSYATVKIPIELANNLDALASDLGYRSRAEIVNDAIRRFIDERKRLDIVPGPEKKNLGAPLAPMIRRETTRPT